MMESPGMTQPATDLNSLCVKTLTRWLTGLRMIIQTLSYSGYQQSILDKSFT